MIQFGVTVYASNATLNSVLYIPTCYLLAEHVHCGTLVYGVRKSIVFRQLGPSPVLLP